MHPTIGITAGDPAGIGLEVILKSITPVLRSAHFILFADRAVYQRNRERFNPSVDLELHDLGDTASDIAWGKPGARSGQRALAYLEAASGAALSGKLDAIVTAPVSKEMIGPAFRGQTDYLAERARSAQYAMVLF
jgi:4-hydroxythreonine-4-phosphate dehydrogenase